MALRSRTPPNAGAAALPERGDQRFAAGMQGGREAAEEARGHTDQEREKQQARIDGRLQRVRRRVAGQERDQSPHGERGQSNAERSACEREQHAVGEKLASDRARAKRPARGAC